MKWPAIAQNLEVLLNTAAELPLTRSDRFIVFSDLHVGNRGSRDDFVENSKLFMHAVRNHYFNKKYTIVLNGDIEELQRFDLKIVENRWKDLYDLFALFKKNNRLVKLVGNHDYSLLGKKHSGVNADLLRSVKLNFGGRYIFIFHGHQASVFFENFNYVSGFFLRYLAKPLGIKNYSVSGDNKKKFETEQRVYFFAKANKLISLIGHTHRPLFESLSKVDILRFQIEDLLKRYPNSSTSEQREMEKNIKDKLTELKMIHTTKKQYSLGGSIYSEMIVDPVLFNSGCAIGKRGITGIEIVDGVVSLIHWFDAKKNRSYLDTAERLDKSSFYRAVLQQAPLDHIFTRISLLS